MDDIKKDPFEEYIRQSEPTKRELGYAWYTAMGLQAVDGLDTSDYLKKQELSLDLPFFTKQRKIVLRLLGHSDPEDLGEYIANGGYQGLMKALTMKPEEVLEIIKKSCLRGRGGGGFPTGTKWEMLAKSPLVDGEKFMICNGDEGDPGAYMDSCILGGGSHAVLEGMMIGAYATGATSGWFYIRAEYPLAIQRMELAIKQAKRYGILGQIGRAHV